MCPKTSADRRRSGKEEILAFLPLLFQSADVGKLTGAPHLFLNRARKRGDIKCIVKGYYINTWKAKITGKNPSIEQIACFVRRPSYISCEWALSAHNVIDQVPTVCTVITLVSSVGRRNRIDLEGTGIEYSKIKERLFWGYEFANNAYMALPEKAILDTIYLRQKLPVSDEINWEFVDRGKLRNFLVSYPQAVRSYLQNLDVGPMRDNY
ncbi:MAG: hypothetical protein C4530_00195 [Desulfobacteraceae bacterium]|nr:MAG: hypothetical protein C4530_00195 [Desulfobacteraceae bacterium]